MITQQRIGRVAWQGLQFGPGSRYHVTALSGLDDLPDLRTADVPHPISDGDDLGEDYAAPRVLGLSLGLRGDTPDQLRVLIEDLKRATAKGAHGWLEFLDRGVAVEARLRRRLIPEDAEHLWRLGDAELQLVCGDPRVYGLTEQSATAGLPVPEAGLDWGPAPGDGLDWTTGAGGLDWGGGASNGDLVCHNAGSASAHPTIEITGPGTIPSVRNITTGRLLEYDLVLAASDVLVVDTRAGTVRLSGADRIGDATNRSEPEQLFTLVPGENVLAFRSADASATGATCTARWRSAAW